MWSNRQLQILSIEKKQRSGKLTEGIVKDVLTKALAHPHGIKVRLESGEIGLNHMICLD